MLALKDTASSCDSGKAFLDLSSVIEGKLIFTKQSLMERGGHEKPGGRANRGPAAPLRAFSSVDGGPWDPGQKPDLQLIAGGSLSQSSPAPDS